jgi:predicted DNA-binding protein (UPF0278 family)
VTNINDQNLKDETQRIKNFCGIVSRIGIDRFKVALSQYIKPVMSVYRELEDFVGSSCKVVLHSRLH